MAKKICIITGANSGIGKAAAIQIAQAGLHVVLACRNQERGEAARQQICQRSGSDWVELMIVDMSLQSSIRAFAETFLTKYDVLDVLIHNAAAFDTTKKKPSITEEGVESIWATNHVGPVFLTELLLEALKGSEQDSYLAVSDEVAETTGAYFDDPTHRASSSGYSRDRENIGEVMALTMGYLQTGAEENGGE